MEFDPEYNRFRICLACDDNIEEIRSAYPNGLHFVVGDTHGEVSTLLALMEKIRFDPNRDHVYFVGDYNRGGDVTRLLRYLSVYYREDASLPGFHLIRGNHERELKPVYSLENLPDMFVLKGTHLDYYIAHAGMVYSGLRLIGQDVADAPMGSVHAYRLTEEAASYDAPLRQIVWSRNGLYSQHSQQHLWPSTDLLRRYRACILHGHTPFCMLKRGDYSLYGGRSLFWKDQHIWFSEDLQSYNLDSNVKGRHDPTERYRGLTCVCLEIIEEIAAASHGKLTVEAVLSARNGVFGKAHIPECAEIENADIEIILRAHPNMKTISIDAAGNPYIV